MEGMDFGVDLTKINEPYDNQWALVSDFTALLDLRLYYLYKYHMWVGPENHMNKMLGMVVTRQEFEQNLVKANDFIVGINLEEEEIEDIDAIDEYFQSRMKATQERDAQIPLCQLIRVFKLNTFLTNCLLLGLVSLVDKKYEKIFIYLQDNMTKSIPTAESAIKLFAPPYDKVVDYMDYFNEQSFFSKFILEAEAEKTFLEMPLRLKKKIVDFLLSSDKTDNGLQNKNQTSEANGVFTQIYSNQEPLQPPYMNENNIEGICKIIKNSSDDITNIIYLNGETGNGKKFIVKQVMHEISSKIIFVNVEYMLEENLKDKMLEVIGEAILEEAYLCFTSFEYLLEDENKKELFLFLDLLNENISYIKKHIFITSNKNWNDTKLPRSFVKINIPLEMPTENERLVLWNEFSKEASFKEKVDIEELATKFRFTIGQIKSSIEQAEGLRKAYSLQFIDTELIHKCCYEQVVTSLSTLGSKIEPSYNWEDIVLPQDQLEILKQACMRVKYKHTVYYKWGFDKRVTYGKGLSMLFAGPPGTGKTMGAQVIAHELHMQSYKIQLSQVISKYIGETEKNLEKIFREAKNANCILFFDEMDALFGKRSEVKDSNDRHANIEVAYLLQQMEEYDGIIIMATNLLQNIDDAFMRRINYIINFPFPDENIRLNLWKKLLDVNAPVADDLDLKFMANQFKVAGGNIKNIVIGAAFLAASEGSSISMKHLLKSAVQEQRKNNIIIVKEDLKEYADLIF